MACASLFSGAGWECPVVFRSASPFVMGYTYFTHSQLLLKMGIHSLCLSMFTPLFPFPTCHCGWMNSRPHQGLKISTCLNLKLMFVCLHEKCQDFDKNRTERHQQKLSCKVQQDLIKHQRSNVVSEIPESLLALQLLRGISHANKANMILCICT